MPIEFCILILIGALTDFIYPSPSFTEEEELCKKKELTDTKVAQPAIGAASLARSAIA